MLTDKMYDIANRISTYIISTFPIPFQLEVFSGNITSKDIIKQILVECSKYAYDQTQPKHSLRFYLEKNNSLDDSERMLMQRTMAYIRRCRTRQAQELESFGWYANGLEPKQLDTIEKKLAGNALNSFQFWEVCNVYQMKLVKAIVERRLGKPNFSTEKMKVYTYEYDEFVQRCFGYCQDLCANWFADL